MDKASNLLLWRRYAVLMGVAVFALGSAVPVVAQIWIPNSPPLTVVQKWAVVAQLLTCLMFLGVGSWLVLARPSLMTWGFYWFLVGWRAPLLGFGETGWQARAWVIGDMLVAVGSVGLIVFMLRFPYDRVVGWRRRMDRAMRHVYLPLALLWGTSDVASLVRWHYRRDLLYAYWGTMVLADLLAVGVLLVTFAQARGETRQRLFWIAALPVALAVREVRFWIVFQPFGANAEEWLSDVLIVTSIIVPITVAYAIIRHRVFDIRFALNRAMVFGMITAFIAGIFVAIDWLLSRNGVSSSIQLAVYIAVALGVGFSLNAVQRRVGAGIDAMLFRQRYLARRGFDELYQALYSVNSRTGMHSLLVQSVPDTLNTASAAVFERLDDAGYFRSAATHWPPEATWHILSDHPLATAQRRVSRIDGVEWFDQADIPPEKRAAIAVPIIVSERAEALFRLGPHRDGTDFDGSEMELLRRLSSRLSSIYGALPRALNSARWATPAA